MIRKKAIICYAPVLHEGYRRFLEKYAEADLFILGQDLISQFDYLYKEIRALEPEKVKKAVEAWGIFPKVGILNTRTLTKISKDYDKFILPREDIMEEIAEKYLKNKKVTFDEVFLRWDKHNTTKKFPVNPDRKITRARFDKEMMLTAHKIRKRSSDWWRRIGAVIVKNGEVIISAYNKHVPSEHMSFVNGDPRSGFHKGDHLELSTAIHSETWAIAEAAKKGLKLSGTSIYVTTFPCPPCSKLIAYSGIKKLYYTVGYGVLDGESILKQNGVEIIFVDVNLPEEKGLGVIKYKK